jgi:hypothetical protein
MLRFCMLLLLFCIAVHFLGFFMVLVCLALLFAAAKTWKFLVG